MAQADHYSDHMVKTVTATEAKATILALLDEVEAGDEVEITRHGRLVARLMPARPAHALWGKLVGVVWQTVDDEELMKPIPAEEWESDWDWVADRDEDDR